MAAWSSLEPRVKALQSRGLSVQSVYRGTALPDYLKQALETDVYIINSKGLESDEALCVVKLEWLEKLLAQRGKA